MSVETDFQLECDLCASACSDVLFAKMLSGITFDLPRLWRTPKAQALTAYAVKYATVSGSPLSSDAMSVIADSLPTTFDSGQRMEMLRFWKEQIRPIITQKPPKWQFDKSERYFTRRNDEALAERITEADADAEGEETAEKKRNAAKRDHEMFSALTIRCNEALSDMASVLALANSRPPLFKIDGYAGVLLNPHLKRDNFIGFVAGPKAGKTSILVQLAVKSLLAGNDTLFISCGDESEVKINGRIATLGTGNAVAPEFAGEKAVPIPDCLLNAEGNCPLGMGGVPRKVKPIGDIVKDFTPLEMLDDTLRQLWRDETGNPYVPCDHCYCPFDGTQTPAQVKNSKHFKAGVWWKKTRVDQITPEALSELAEWFALTTPAKLRISECDTGKFTPSNVDRLLDTLDAQYGFVPSVLIIDYVDLMKQEEGRRSDKDHDGMRRLWETLRDISKRRDILVLTVTQLNRAGFSQESATLENLGRTKTGADNCTAFFAINQTFDEHRMGLFRLSKLVAREGHYDPEHQALCYSRLAVQNPFALSAFVYKRVKYKSADP
ncbi:MAG: hypothetical protein FWH21_00910 [Kiritimatiellaeota bacterium]|nr:hypothetical protein [Kiritimatiellota bacterium]